MPAMLGVRARQRGEAPGGRSSQWARGRAGGRRRGRRPAAGAAGAGAGDRGRPGRARRLGQGAGRRPGSSGCSSRPPTAVYEADPVTFLTAVRLIASACGSTGWVASVLGVHPWQLALFPRRRRRRSGVPTRPPGCRPPTRRPAGPRLAEGGHRLTGRWSFSSGCDHATWVLLGGIVTDGEGRPVDFRTFLLPASDYEIEDVWDTVGLRGTGSNDIVVDGVFVPEHRSLSFTDVSAAPAPARRSTPRRCTGCRTGRCSPTRSRRRSSAWRSAPMTRTWRTSASGCAPPTPARRRRGPVRAGPGSPRPRPSWTRPGWRSSTTWPSSWRTPARGEDPAPAAAAGPARPGARHRPGDQRGGPAVRELRRPRAEDRHADPAVLARRARRPGACHQRPGAGAVDVRPRRVRPRPPPDAML